MSHTQFRTCEIFEAVDDKGFYARYYPEFAYRITDRNRGLVEQMIADGRAKGLDEKAAKAFRISAGQPLVSGAISVGHSKEK